MNNTKESANLISDDEFVTAYECGDYIEIVCCKHEVSSIDIKRLNKSQYIYKQTGDVREYNFSEFKSIDRFKRDFKYIPLYLKGYFYGDKSEKFITLTYSLYMDKPYKLSADFKKFILKIERRCGKCRYFYVKEPQDNGSWHIHAIIKSMEFDVFPLEDSQICSLWKQGTNVNVQNIYNINTLAYYFDITRDEQKIQRLKYYPPYLHIFAHSADMKIYKRRGTYKNLKPQNVGMTYEGTNGGISVDEETGEITNCYKNIYQQFVNKI